MTVPTRFSMDTDGHGRLIALLLATALGSFSCTPNEGTAVPTPADPPPTSPAMTSNTLGNPTAHPSFTDSPERAVLAAYTGMWAAVAAASENPDQPHNLAHYATGQALTSLSRTLVTDARLGVHTTGRPVLTPRVLVLIPPARPAKARVRDCCDTTSWVKYQRSGLPAPGETYGRRQVDALVKITDGQWKVTEFVVNGVGTC